MKNLFLFLLLSTFLSAQDFEVYPRNQVSYVGGNVQFYKDFNKILVEKSLKPCDNKKEYYDFRIIVYPDKTIKYIKDADELNVQNNKCAFDLARNAAKYMKGWKPAVIDGKEVPAITGYLIIPSHLFENYTENYDAEKTMKHASFDDSNKLGGGIPAFRSEIAKKVNISGFTFTARQVRVVITFYVGTEGQIEDIEVSESSGLKEFDDRFVNALKSIKKKWKPAEINDIPVRYRFKIPFVVNVE